ncbi:MAG: hypothetical protein RJA35_888 [Actinomycetota bacterium]
MKIQKSLAIVAGASIVLAPVAFDASQALAANHAVSGNLTVVASPSASPAAIVSLPEAIAAYTAAAATLATVSADATATNQAKQQAFQNAKQAYMQVVRSAAIARMGIDKTFRDAVSAAKQAYRLAVSIPGINADQKLAAKNAADAAVAAAATAHDAAYRAIVIPAPPVAPALTPKAPKGPNPVKTPKN